MSEHNTKTSNLNNEPDYETKHSSWQKWLRRICTKDFVNYYLSPTTKYRTEFYRQIKSRNLHELNNLARTIIFSEYDNEFNGCVENCVWRTDFGRYVSILDFFNGDGVKYITRFNLSPEDANYVDKKTKISIGALAIRHGNVEALEHLVKSGMDLWKAPAKTNEKKGARWAHLGGDNAVGFLPNPLGEAILGAERNPESAKIIEYLISLGEDLGGVAYTSNSFTKYPGKCFYPSPNGAVNLELTVGAEATTIIEALRKLPFFSQEQVAYIESAFLRINTNKVQRNVSTLLL